MVADVRDVLSYVSGYMATLHAKGSLPAGGMFRMGSVTGAVVEGTVLSETEVGGLAAIVPQIAGTATVVKAPTIFN